MIGTEIASYRILEKLGEGGMGVVYKAVDTALDRMVAVKVLSGNLSGNPELEQRFRAEAKAQANLNQTNLATLYAFVIQDGSACMVMEFVDGETFEDMILRGPIPPQEAVPLFKQALLGIGYAHRAGIVHRDIKPSNLMVNRQGIVKVMDFGIAKVMGARGMTKTGALLGTGWYMSPEQVLNKPVDIRSDIYSLGITLYQMLTTHVPFESNNDFQVMSDHMQTPPPPPTHFYPYIPKGIENAVLKALEKSPANRFQTVEEFGAALESSGELRFVPPVVRAAPAPANTPQQTAPPPIAPVQWIAPVPQVHVSAQRPASPLFATPTSKLLAIGAVLLLVLLTAWFSWRSAHPDAIGLPSSPMPTSNGPTPLERLLSTPSPGAQMSASTGMGPRVVSFQVDSAFVAPGTAVRLSWSVNGASQVIITPGVGMVNAQGSVNVPVSRTTQFTLVAKNEKGEAASSSTTVMVAPAKATPAPQSQMSGHVPVDTTTSTPRGTPLQMQMPTAPARLTPGIAFHAVPSSVQPGGAVVLQWNLTNANTATIQPAVGVLRQTNGQVRVNPAETTIYTLTATSKDGATSTSTATVEVLAATRSGLTMNVVHDHGAAFGQNNNVWPRCWGALQVVGNRLTYRVIGTNDGRRDDFDFQLAQVQEAAANKMPIRNQQTFHVTVGGQHFNFIPQGTSAHQAAAAIENALQAR